MRATEQNRAALPTWNTSQMTDLSRIGRDYLQVGFYTEVLFREKGVYYITALAELREIVFDIKKRYWDNNGEIKNTEKLLHRKNELIEQAEKYLKYRPYQHKYAQIPLKQQEMIVH